MRLTETFIRKIKPQDRYQDFSDDGSPLNLRVKANGEKIFFWRGRQAGKQVKPPIGTFPDMSLDEARATAIKMKSEARTMVAEPEIHWHHRPKVTTVREAFERYMDAHGNHLESASTIRGLIELRIMPTYAGTDITTITRKGLNEHFNAMRAHYAGAGINRVLANTKAFLNWCVREDILEHNPAHNIQKKAPEKARMRVLRDKELGWLQTALGDVPSVSDALKLLLHTVCREADILHLTWGDVVEVDGDTELHIPRTKAGVPHIAYLTPQAKRFLPERPEDAKPTDRVFKDAPKMRSGKWLTITRGRVNELAGYPVEHFTFHDFRTAATTYLADQQGRGKVFFTDRALDLLLAHLPKGVTKRHYNHSEALVERKQMLTLWSNYLDNCAKMVAEK